MIHVVIVAYRSADHIAPCLRGLLDDPGVSSVVVVDNSSDPETQRICGAIGDDRVEYRSSANVGYAAACNIGIAARRGNPEFVAIVNPDLALTRRLSQLADNARHTPGTIYSAIVAQRGVNIRPLVSPARELLACVVGSRAYKVDPPQPAARFVEVGQVDGSLMLLRTDEAIAMGPLDERFELYYEDVDYCRRAHDRSGCLVWTEVWGVHDAGASFQVGGAAPFVTLRVSRLRYLRKWFGLRGIVAGTVGGAAETVIRLVLGSAPSRTAVRRAWSAQLGELKRPGVGVHLV